MTRALRIVTKQIFANRRMDRANREVINKVCECDSDVLLHIHGDRRCPVRPNMLHLDNANSPGANPESTHSPDPLAALLLGQRILPCFTLLIRGRKSWLDVQMLSNVSLSNWREGDHRRIRALCFRSI